MTSCSRNARQVGGNAHAHARNTAHKAHGGARKRSSKKRSSKKRSSSRRRSSSRKRSSSKRSSSKRSSKKRSSRRRRSSRGGNPIRNMLNKVTSVLK